MQLQTLTPRRLAGIAGYLLVGLAGTAGLAVAVLRWGSRCSIRSTGRSTSS